MASKLEFVQYVVDQLQDAGEITYRKMFGEYGIYCDGKFFATICDDQLFSKLRRAGGNIGRIWERESLIRALSLIF